jgi:N-acetylmuramoyl-L-alanine amidase
MSLRPTKPRRHTDYIVIHCSATTANQDVGVREIDLWHRKRSFLCIGYHKVIRRNGTIEDGRDLDVIGAHVEGHNHNSIGICMAGGVDANDIAKAENNFTPEQWTSLESLVRELRVLYPTAEVLGHRDFPNVQKACPSFDAREWAREKGFL